MEQQEFKTIQQISEDTIICDGVIFWTRIGYMKLLQLSDRSISTPYHHVKRGKAEQFKLFSIPFFRPL